MSVAYKGAGTGVTTEASSGNLNPTCPATVDVGDILIAHVAYEGTATTPSTPAGWTLLTASGYAVETNDAMHWIFGKIAVGNEDSAAISFGTPAVTTMRTGRIYSFSGRTSGTILQCVPTASFAHLSNATDPAFPDVTTTTIGALAVACIYQMDDNGLVSATGESGGNWTEAVAEYAQSDTTPDSQLGLQTCTPTANPGTVTGGTISTANDSVGVIGFQIIGNFVPTAVTLTTPTDAANNQSVTPSLIFTGTDPDADEVEYEVQVSTSSSFGGSNSFYIDGHTSVSDPDAVWTNDSLAFNSSNSDDAYVSAATIGSSTSRELYAKGSNASTDGFNINSVSFRVTYQNTGTTPATGTVHIYTQDLAEDIGNISCSIATTKTTTAFTTLNTPFGGWTWDKITNLEAKCWVASTDASASFLVYSVYLQVDTVPLLDTLSSTDDDANWTGTGSPNPFPSGNAITYTIPVASALTAGLTHYWRVRAIDPLGSNTWGAYPTAFSFTTAAAGGPANLKTWNGLAKASIKTFNGLGISSVKTINGLT